MTTPAESDRVKVANLQARAPAKAIPLDRGLDGARILYRNFLSRTPPREGWVRELSADGSLARISKTNDPADAGLWMRVQDQVVEAVLEPSKAPATTKQEDDE